MSVSVCQCVCVLSSVRDQNYTSDLHQIFVLVTYGRGSVLLWRLCDRPYITYFWFYGWYRICT